MGFESSNSIVAAILTFAFVAVGTVLLVIYVLIAKEKRVATVRELRTDKVPELTLELGLAYHAFLSHVWSSGQDQCAVTKQYPSGNPTYRTSHVPFRIHRCAVIKRQLRFLLPGIRVFLDVDDLTDISLLETYIEHSASIVVFLSKVHACRTAHPLHITGCTMLIVSTLPMQGYFYSRNCLREVRATVEYGKPVVFVHEEDEARGGAPVEELALQCPADHRRYLFESGFKIIPCSRMRKLPS